MNADEARELQSNLLSQQQSKEKHSENKRKTKKNIIMVNEQFVVQECIYKGQFYNTYKGYDRTGKTNVVIKMCNQYHEHISEELKTMKKLQNATCFASPIWAGEEKIKGVNYQVKVLKQMGPSLKIVFGLQNRKLFSKKKTYLNREEKINHYEEQKLNFVAENYKDIIPPEIINFLSYLKMVNQNDKIDYDYIRKQFKAGYQRVGGPTHDQHYEWAQRIEQDLKAFQINNQETILNQQNIILQVDQDPNIELSPAKQPEIIELKEENVAIVLTKNNSSKNNIDQNISRDDISPQNSPSQMKDNSYNSLKQLDINPSINNIKNKSVFSQQNSLTSISSTQHRKNNTESQINVLVNQTQQGATEIVEKYDYQAFLRMNSTDDPVVTGSNLLKDPFLKQASNLSKMSDRSLFSRFNSKSFEEGVCEEITTQCPSLENQISQLGDGINPFLIFSVSGRGKYFRDQTEKQPQYIKRITSKIEEADEEDQTEVIFESFDP